MKNVLIAMGLFLLTVPAFAAEHTVKMLNNGDGGMMIFEPAVLQVSVGDTVNFVATDMAHNSASVFTPPGATTWNGAMSQDISVTLDTPGIYIYECTPHAMMAMVGVIQVKDGMDLDLSLDSAYVDAADTFAEVYKNKFVMNNDRLDNYLSDLLSKFFE
jgi:pseudoazurin